MRHALKYFIFIMTTMNTNAMEVKQFYVQVVDSRNNTITDVNVLVDGLLAKYDSVQKLYSLKKESGTTWSLHAAKSGYNTVDLEDISVSQYFIKICLLQSSDHYYYDQNIKIGYPARSNELLVMLKGVDMEKHLLTPDMAVKKLLPLLDKLGLEIKNNYYDGKKELPKKYLSQSYQLIIVKKDGSPYPMQNCTELKTLREFPFVNYAGPVVLHGNHFYEAYTFDNVLMIELSGNSKNIKDWESFLMTFGDNISYKLGDSFIILDAGAGEIIPEIVSKMRKTGIFNYVEMTVRKLNEVDK